MHVRGQWSLLDKVGINHTPIYSEHIILVSVCLQPTIQVCTNVCVLKQISIFSNVMFHSYDGKLLRSDSMLKLFALIEMRLPLTHTNDGVHTRSFQPELCSSALTDIIHNVINGSDGCVICLRSGSQGALQGYIFNTNQVKRFPLAFRIMNDTIQTTIYIIV